MKLFTKISVIILVSLPFTSLAGPLSPTWKEIRDQPLPDSYGITQYLTVAGAQSLVIIAGGSNNGMVKGANLLAMRPVFGAQGPQKETSESQTVLWVETGKLRTIEVQPDFSIAQVESQGSTLASAFFSDFPRIMAGDIATIQKVTIARRPIVLPSVTLSYFDIFEDPKGRPSSYELTAKGLDTLRKAALTFANARLSLLMIEGYTDHKGDADINQTESYQRALTIRQILIDEFGFDESRVVAVGYGEIEPVDDSLSPGFEQRNRRIVLKAVPLETKTKQN